MIKFFSLFALFFSLHIFGQNNKCLELSSGEFELYEGKNLIGKIYRKDGIQVERYESDLKYTLTKYKKISQCLYILKAYTIDKQIDTLTLQVSYEKVKKNKYSFKVKPRYVDFDGFIYQGKLIKVKDSIENKTIKNLLNKL